MHHASQGPAREKSRVMPLVHARGVMVLILGCCPRGLLLGNFNNVQLFIC